MLFPVFKNYLLFFIKITHSLTTQKTSTSCPFFFLHKTVILDLKGCQYHASIKPGPTALVVGLAKGGQLKVESITDEFATIVQTQNILEKLDGVVEGEMDDSFIYKGDDNVNITTRNNKGGGGTTGEVEQQQEGDKNSGGKKGTKKTTSTSKKTTTKQGGSSDNKKKRGATSTQSSSTGTKKRKTRK